MKTRALSICVGIAIAALSSFAADEKPRENQQSASDVPRDATAICVDGSWSSAKHRSGACSSHGGVKQWFGKPPKGASARCKDGTYSKAKDTQGACSNHGGIAYKLKQGKPGS